MTVDGKDYRMEEPFFVLATQNPIEQEGTYALPEAQVDRFMFKLLMRYPTVEEMKKAALLFALCVKLVSVDKLLGE